ncbi:DNA adenine methylase [Senegalia sp. (in: firmicutes)]|uniref:DNA adenine methylase n=1 Tax=Bacillota TaxID=1239 RepID=UPI003F94A5C8
MENYEFPKVNYIGNKKKIVEWIGSNIPLSEGIVLDLFAGGSSVSYYLKQKGYEVITNDALYASFVINKALIENKDTKLKYNEIEEIKNTKIDKKLRKKLNWLEKNLFYSDEVDELSKFVNYSFNLPTYEKYLLQALIRRSMIRKLPYSRMNVDWKNILKLRDEDYSYRKYGRRRAYHNQSFEYHILDNLENYNNSIFDNARENRAIQMDFMDALNSIDSVDIIYLDPPYPGTMNNYEGFYGSFDKIFDKEIEITNIRKKEDFLNNIENILRIAQLKSKFIVMSLNSNSTPSYEEIMKLMSNYGSIRLESRKHNYQLSGKKKKNSNFEILLILEF